MTDEAKPATDEEITAWDQSEDATHRCATPWRSSCRCALIARIRAEVQAREQLEELAAHGFQAAAAMPMIATKDQRIRELEAEISATVHELAVGEAFREAVFGRPVSDFFESFEIVRMAPDLHDTINLQKAKVARLRGLMVRYVKAEDALTHYTDETPEEDLIPAGGVYGDWSRAGVEADLAEEEMDALEAIRTFARAALGESKG